MNKLSVEMPIVKKCDVDKCGFNVNNNCHAKAITVGDGRNPGCDTFFEAKIHTHDSKRVAGVGACKVSDCVYNSDYECMAENISVGFVGGNVKCKTFVQKK